MLFRPRLAKSQLLVYNTRNRGRLQTAQLKNDQAMKAPSC